MKNFFEKIIGSYSDRELKRIMPIVAKIEAFEEQYKAMPASELKGKTKEFRDRLKNGEELDDLLPEAFAAVREASDRVLGMRHFRVQLIGGIVLHQGRISEMKTGEGKTLVATLPAYLNALPGDGVHIVTVNDYLAKRDSEWMGKIYQYLGLSVGLIVNGLSPEQRTAAYAADITYGTNNELGFDYLRDNMALTREGQVQRSRNYAIIDEVDSILIDEARTPLIIAGASDKSTQLYEVANNFAKNLSKHVVIEEDTKHHDDTITADYIVDEKAHSVSLTEHGIKKAEAAFNIENLSDPDNMLISHHINQAIRAHGIMKRDKDYVVKDGEVLIVDEFTGRIMNGRRYSDGLHQAIEAKEHVKVERETRTVATITFQNFFRLYNKLSGMTGTAQTEEDEFQTIYRLDVVVIPTNVQGQRKDYPDSVYKNKVGKQRAIINQIKECYDRGQPVLVGTVSVEKSEDLSRELKKIGVKHEVLNAKHHDKEAEIVAQAGKVGAVTIATNMAGRGTDIVLGGNAEFLAKREMHKKGIEERLIIESTGFGDTTDEEILQARALFKELNDKYKKQAKEEHKKVLEAGGLFIVGTERHESRRIDNQLRGRSGRQGDQGASRFFIALDDDLMRLFGSDKIKGMIEATGFSEDQALEFNMLTNMIESAQKKVEGRNFDSRKNVLQYDDVMNIQRNIIYTQRQKVLEGEDLSEAIQSYLNSVITDISERTAGQIPHSEEWSWEIFHELSEGILGVKIVIDDKARQDMSKESLIEMLTDAATKLYERKEREFTPEIMRELERTVLLRVVDQKWMDHIDDMSQLESGIRLRSYGQRDPVIEYKFEGMSMFESMIEAIKEDTIKFIMHASPAKQHRRERVSQLTNLRETRGGDADAPKKPIRRAENKVGRNDPCPCGSGKKYKKCCGE